MADRLRDFRTALADAHRVADWAHHAAWRARRRGDALSEAWAALATTIQSEPMRTALTAEVTAATARARQYENEACRNRDQLGELVRLLGVKEGKRG